MYKLAPRNYQMQKNKLNIALIGYGKMGKTIEKIATSRGHHISLKITSRNLSDLNAANLKNIDAAIEFTTPEAAADNLLILAQHKIPTACGTTAWLSRYDEVCQAFNSAKSAFLYASNFSIGVNIFFALNKQLAKMMDQLSDYDISMTESHHISKLDAPSGTAVTLAEQIMEEVNRKSNWSKESADSHDYIAIKSIREGDVKGMHEINYTSSIDEIKIKHEAFSRDGFALGSVLAVEWLFGKQGVYGMSDVLELG